MKLTYALLRKQRTHNLRYIVRTLLMKLVPEQVLCSCEVSTKTTTSGSYCFDPYRFKNPKHKACEDPGIFVSRYPGPFLTTFSLVLNLFYSRRMVISKKTIIFQGSRGDPTFSSGVQLFPSGVGGRGVQLLIPYRNKYTL